MNELLDSNTIAEGFVLKGKLFDAVVLKMREAMELRSSIEDYDGLISNFDKLCDILKTTIRKPVAQQMLEMDTIGGTQ